MTEEQQEPPYLLWLDLETTGLDPSRDAILEIAWSLTTFHFPYHDVDTAGARAARVIPYHGTSGEPFALDDYRARLSPFILDMHTKSGLISALASEKPCRRLHNVEDELLALSNGWPSNREARVPLAGNSVHFDLSFLRAQLPTFAARLSHRTFDVSNVIMVAQSLGMPPLPRCGAHRAEADLANCRSQLDTCLRYLAKSDLLVGSSP